MAESLQRPFDNLSLRPPPQQSSHRRPSNDPARLIELTIPQINTYGRRMYYGFEINKEWVASYSQRECRKRGYSPGSPPAILFDLTVSLRILLEDTGIRKILIKTVYGQGELILPPDAPISWPLPPSGPQIFAICSSRSAWFEKRPTQAQVDKMKQIIGKEPKWWVYQGF